jgi:acyl phosphate:glycerol-3-phosphate acyltransferase
VNPLLLVSALACGYLVGSISFARIVGGRVTRGQDLSQTEYEISSDGRRIVSTGVSPAAVGSRAGGRWGCLTALLDIGKSFAVTMAFVVAAPDTEAAFAAAIAAVVGHAYPIYHRFVGGFGQSPILGTMLALDAISVPVVTLAGYGIGLAVADALLAYEGWPLLIIPWAIWRGEPGFIAYAVIVNVVYWVRMWPEVRQRIQHQREHPRSWRERLKEIRKGYM